MTLARRSQICKISSRMKDTPYSAVLVPCVFSLAPDELRTAWACSAYSGRSNDRVPDAPDAPDGSDGAIRNSFSDALADLDLREVLPEKNCQEAVLYHPDLH